MPTALDPARFRLNSGSPAIGTPRSLRAGPRRHNQGKFIRGPLPLDWLDRAAALPGRAFHVGVWLFYLKGVKRTSTVRLSGAKFGLTRWTVQRGLHELERAGLVTVERSIGKAPLVTLLDVAQQQTGP